MITPEPVPDSCWPVTSMVTTLGRILAAAAPMVPSSWAAGAPVALVILRPVLTELPLCSVGRDHAAADAAADQGGQQRGDQQQPAAGPGAACRRRRPAGPSQRQLLGVLVARLPGVAGLAGVALAVGWL